MKLVVGLGNIGEAYANTRHNLGFICLDYYANKHNLAFKEEKKLKCYLASFTKNGERIILIKPTTYMNLSGEAVSAVMNYYKVDIEDVLVICDDLDSPVGRVRLRSDGSSGGHNGLKNIILHTGTQSFKRIKIGISRNPLIDVASYVLGHFKEEEIPLIEEAVKEANLAIEEFILGVPFNKIASKYSKKWVLGSLFDVR